MTRLVVLTALLACLAALPPARAQGKDKGRKFALLIGVSKYTKSSELSDLKYTDNDIHSLATELTDRAGFDGVRVMTAGGKKADEPTAENIAAAVSALAAGKGPDDLILIAFAGHGAQVVVRDPSGERGPKMYTCFCPADANLGDIDYATGRSKTLVNISHLIEDVNLSKAGAKLFLIDCCRSDVEKKLNQRGPLDGAFLPSGVAVLFSCGPNQRAWETDKSDLGKGGKGHGVFFYYVVQGLRGRAADTNGEVTWDGLSKYVTKEVEQAVPKLIGGGARQKPNGYAEHGDQVPVLARGVRVAGFEEAAARHPGRAAFLKGLAFAEGRGVRHDPEEAARQFRESAERKYPLGQAALAYTMVTQVKKGQKGDDDEARELGRKCYLQLEALAETDGDAMVYVGRMYAAGLVGRQKDPRTALEWYHRAAKAGSSLAMLEVGLALLVGRGTDPNGREALAWIDRAAGRGNVDAMYFAGRTYHEGLGGRAKDAGQARAWMRKAADLKHRLAQKWIEGNAS